MTRKAATALAVAKARLSDEAATENVIAYSFTSAGESVTATQVQAAPLEAWFNYRPDPVKNISIRASNASIKY